MAEFKKLSAVEAVNTVSDTASVLIEEDGVIKRAPKGEVGGVKVASTAEVGQTIVVKAVDEAGNPTEWECADLEKKPDMVITITQESYFSITTPTADTVTISEGSVQTVLDAITEGRSPIVKIRFVQTIKDYLPDLTKCIEEQATVFTYGDLYVACQTTDYYVNWYTIWVRFGLETGTFDYALVKKLTTTAI